MVVNGSLRNWKSQALASLSDYNLESLWNDTLVIWVVFWVFLEHYWGILEFWYYDSQKYEIPSTPFQNKDAKSSLSTTLVINSQIELLVVECMLKVSIRNISKY